MVIAAIGWLLISWCNAAGQKPGQPGAVHAPCSLPQPVDPANPPLPVALRATPSLPSEVWYVIYDGDFKVGNSVVRWRTSGADSGNPDRIEWTQHTSLTIRRFGADSTQQIVLTSVERPDGTVDRFSSEHLDGEHRTLLRGVRDGDRWELDLDDRRPVDDAVIEGASALRGFFALEQSLSEAPLRPGDRRTLHCLFPLSTTPAEVELNAGEIGSTRLLRDEARLLRIRGQIRLGSQVAFEFDAWQDEAGRVSKTHVPATRQTTFIATGHDAVSETPLPDADVPDLADLTLIPVSSVTTNPHLAEHVDYVIRAGRGTLRGRFPHTATQTVRELTDDSLVISVGAKNGADRSALLSETRPDPLSVQANHWIESDDPLIVRMSREVAGDESDPLATAHSLTTHVANWLEHKDYGRAWDSAATVARSRRGDCSEHAVLTAALCRAHGIPARIAFGLVYLHSRQSFACHAWTEVWISGQWVGLDATRDPGLIGAGHIKVGDSHLSGTTAQVAVLPLTQLLGQGISIELASTKP